MAEPVPFRRRLKSLGEFREPPWKGRWRKGGRSDGGSLPSNWQPYLRRRLVAADVRIMIWLGLLLGLLVYQAARQWPAPDLSPIRIAAETPDPYQEARRSREILTEQEGAPPSALISNAGSEEGLADGSVTVTDGDTFDYRGITIRIADIDTPEVRGRCRREAELAARATARMSALLAAGPFELQPNTDGRDEDRYGRKLRIVTRAGHSLGEQLVAEGLARSWSGRRRSWC